MSLTALLASQVTGYEVFDSSFTNDKLKKITYVTAANGVFRVEKTPVAIYKTMITSNETPIPGLLDMEEGPELLIPRIPFKYLQMALSFYIDIYDQDGTEASLLFFWNKDNKPLPAKYSDDTEIRGLMTDGQLIIYVPRQVNQSTLSEFHMDPMVDYLRQNYALLCETHSHQCMGAFFSGTDDKNENATQFYGVWGKVKNDEPQFAFRYVCGEAKVEISPDVLFEWPVYKETRTIELIYGEESAAQPLYQEDIVSGLLYKGPFLKMDYPPDWMAQHEKGRVKSHTTQALGYKASQLEFDYLFREARQYEIDDETTFISGKGIENAQVIQLLDPEDEKILFDINDNVWDMGADYSRIGYDKLIQRCITESKQK